MLFSHIPQNVDANSPDIILYNTLGQLFLQESAESHVERGACWRFSVPYNPRACRPPDTRAKYSLGHKIPGLNTF